jgi:hypothetical protein
MEKKLPETDENCLLPSETGTSLATWEARKVAV